MSVDVRCDAEAALWTRARTICRLRAAAALLTWDQHTALPAGAHAARARQLAELERVSSEQLGDPELTDLLDELAAGEAFDDADTPALVRVLRREHDKARLVPLDLRVEIAGAVSESLAVWGAARRHGSFHEFAPALERQVELRRRYAACFADVDEPYDVCVDDFDPGARTRDVEATLGALKDRLVPMAAELRGRGGEPCPVTGPFAADGQRALATELLRAAGLDLDRARLAVAAHPMTIAIDRDDVGVAMRFRDDDLDGIWLALHELGHALYEQSFDPRLAGSPLAQGASASWHEAQARLFENHVGRHPAFLGHLAERLGRHIPAARSARTAEWLLASARRPRFSPIRLEADELTYALHIVIRFELERSLLDGRLTVADLPAAWAARYAEDLGITVADERDGVLQDVQWALGAFGYFPTYAIGCVIAAQLWERLTTDVHGVDEQLARGETGGVAGWLREHVWSAGRRHTASELLVRATGGELSIEPYIAHLRARFG